MVQIVHFKNVSSYATFTENTFILLYYKAFEYNNKKAPSKNKIIVDSIFNKVKMFFNNTSNFFIFSYLF